jgi:hypothetical protein
MDTRLKQILGVNKTKESVNTDTFLNIQFNDSERLLPPDNINTVLDLGKQFNTERQSCPYYRIVGKIVPLISNVLFNTTGGIDTWQYLNNPIFTTKSLDDDDNEILSFGESIKRNLKEINGWYGYFDPVLTGSGLCNYYDMEPKRERFSFIPDITNIPNTRVKNWELTITYPYMSDKTHKLISNGLLIVDKQLAIVGGKEMTALSVPVLHNLTVGSTIALSGTNMDGEYEIKRIGLDSGELKNYYFCIDVDYNLLAIGNNSRMNKMYNGIKSEYYFRKFKKIKTKSSAVIETDDYEVYKLAFSENIFSDDVTQFTFNEDIDVDGLTDNLGRPLSELYLTIVKTNSNNIFGNISSGIEVPLIQELNNGNTNTYLKNIPAIQKIHNVPSAPTQTFTPLESNILISDDDFYGDVVEYNITTVQETVLSDVFHRFNTINREMTYNGEISGPRPEGYYYKAHQLIKIRDFSSYIEEGNESTAGMPDYKVNLGDGRFLWRDLLDIGNVDINKNVLNYPFVNGCHYMYQNYCFDIKRQDPFDNWNLYHSGFPADPIGNMMNNRFKVNIANNAC